MESEKVENIKIGLECCGVAHSCTYCFYYDGGIGCIGKLSENALTLINDLESENEELKERIAKLEKEIKDNLQYAKGYGEGVKAMVENYTPKKLQEFAERLKEKLVDKIGYDRPYVMRNIDETLKEMLGEE